MSLLLLIAIVGQVDADAAMTSTEKLAASIQAGHSAQVESALQNAKIREVHTVDKVIPSKVYPGKRSDIARLMQYTENCSSYTVRNSLSILEGLRSFDITWSCGGEKRYLSVVTSALGEFVKVYWGGLGYVAPPKGETFLPAVIRSKNGGSNG